MGLTSRTPETAELLSDADPGPLRTRGEGPAGRRNGGPERGGERLERDVHILKSDTFRFLRRHVDAVTSVQGQFAQLVDEVGQARLIPLAEVLEPLPRAARDLARDAAFLAPDAAVPPVVCPGGRSRRGRQVGAGVKPTFAARRRRLGPPCPLVSATSRPRPAGFR